jgi:hypothetical protein
VPSSHIHDTDVHISSGSKYIDRPGCPSSTSASLPLMSSPDRPTLQPWFHLLVKRRGSVYSILQDWRLDRQFSRTKNSLYSFIHGGSPPMGAFAIQIAKAKGSQEYRLQRTTPSSHPLVPKFHAIIDAVALVDPPSCTHSPA